MLILGTTGRVVDDSEEKMGRMLRHFQEHIHNKYNRYAFGFFGCELANLCIAIGAIFATHKFLDHQFLTYGLSVYRYALKTCHTFSPLYNTNKLAFYLFLMALLRKPRFLKKKYNVNASGADMLSFHLTNCG